MSLRRVRLHAVVASALLASSVACSDAIGPTPLPAHAQQFTPEPVFREWWQQMEDCSGMQASFDAVRWYVVPGEEAFYVQGVDYPVVGYWDKYDNKIVLLQYLPNERAPVIRHESLHAILHRTDHPALYFVEKCGGAIDGPDSPDGDGIIPGNY